MKTLSEIKEIISRNKLILKKRYKVNEIGIFGSYARGEPKKGSDIDILVELEEPVSLLQLVSLENFLRDILKMKLEVIPKKDIREELKDKILKETVYI